jgi:glycosyltransferase involved in cell wall biosynthesis
VVPSSSISAVVTDAQCVESVDLINQTTACDSAGVVRTRGLRPVTADFSSPCGVIDYLDATANMVQRPGPVRSRVRGDGRISTSMRNVINLANMSSISSRHPSALNPRRKRLLLFALDLDADTTSSLGIHNYTRRLVAALSELDDPGFDLVLLVSSDNRDVVVPPRLPPWITVHECRGGYGTGLKRLYADHLLSRRLARRLECDAVFFPKGWISLLPYGRRKIIATLHDTILADYQTLYPGFYSPLKIRYFLSATRRTLRRADRVFACSEFGKQCLSELVPGARDRIEVLLEGPGLPVENVEGCEKREGVLVFGSTQPHKAVRQTLELLAKYNVQAGYPLPVNVTGLSGWPSEWGSAPRGHRFTFHGRLPDSELIDLLARSKALVFLSRNEGFGLPVLEALMCGTPVCYLDAHATGELMAGAPGGWDGAEEIGFIQALDAALAQDATAIAAVRDRLAERCNWPSVAVHACRAIRQVLE